MLIILERAENDEPIRNADTASPLDAEAVALIETLLPSLSDEQLRAFIRLQVSEFPQLADNLRIFTQGAVETERAVDDYADEILTALQDGYYRIDEDDEEEYGWYRRIDEDDEEDDADKDDGYDTVDSILEPYRDTAQKYMAQENWIESAKIRAAILHACGQRAQGDDGGDDEEDDEEEDDAGAYDDDYDAIGEQCLTEAKRVLQTWAAVVAEGQGEDKQRVVEQLVPYFARDAYEIGSKSWEDAFQKVILNAAEAQALVTHLDAELYDDCTPHMAGVMLHLLHLSGDTERFLRIGEQAIRDYPHLALPLGDKLTEIGQREEAIRIAEAALQPKSSGFPYRFERDDIREALLRFLIKTCTPETHYAKVVRHAQDLLFDTHHLKDYTFLRDTLQTSDEREKLLRQVVVKCREEAVNDILALEARWDDLLNYARQHTSSRAFPNMMRKLRDHFPEACFDLYRQEITDLLNQGADPYAYEQIADYARQLQDIPDHEDAFGQFMSEIIDTYARRTSMMGMLGDLVQVGRAWKARQRLEGLEGWKQLTPDHIRKLDIRELAQYCPIDFTEARVKARRQAEGQGGNAPMIWAILVKPGGTLDATEITNILARSQNISVQSAAAKRSGGLRLLEVLGHVDIERQGNRLRQVRLLTEMPFNIMQE